MFFIRLRMFSCMSWLLRLLFKWSWMNVEFSNVSLFRFLHFFFFILLIWLITLVDFFHFWTKFPFKGKSHWIGYYGGGALFSVISYSCDSMNCSPPGSFVHGISQARILEWAAISFYRGSFPPRDWTYVSCIAGSILLCRASPVAQR